MTSRRTNNFPESGRGLGHVTATVFGSTVGYPSDSLASCCSANAVPVFKKGDKKELLTTDQWLNGLVKWFETI